MIVAGVMSGTSADGIDVSVAQVLGRGFNLRFQLLGHGHFDYPPAVRNALMPIMNAKSASVADLSRLNFVLGDLYADAVLETMRRTRTTPALIGCHGQTIYHQGEPAPFLGRKVKCTWQLGEGAVVAARCGVPVVSDLRVADMAAGGKAAPLVPFFDYVAYRHRTRGRILQNIGGIANLSAIPAGATPDRVLAFDTGPGNMVIDACMERLFRKPYDADGRIAAKGKVLEHVLKVILRDSYFRMKPPKTTGREEFGREFMARLLQLCKGAAKQDIISTATALTVRTIMQALEHFVLQEDERYRELIVGGGGGYNRTMMRWLKEALEPRGIKVLRTSDFGVPTEAKEALAFALMAHETWHRRPSNVPSATGAKRPAILGKISFP